MSLLSILLFRFLMTQPTSPDQKPAWSQGDGSAWACWVTAAAHTKVMSDRQCWRLRLWVNHGHRVCRKRGLPRSLALSHSECRTLCVPGLWSTFKATLHAVHCGGQPTTRLNCVIKFMASAAEWWQKLLSEQVGGRDQRGRVGQGQHHGIREGECITCGSL